MTEIEGRTTGGLFAGVLLTAALAFLVTIAWELRFVFNGDPSIYLVYAKNLVGGHPFSFNPGTFSSGSTSPLWPVLLAVAYVVLPVSIAMMGAKILAVLVAVLGLCLLCYVGFEGSGSKRGAALSAMMLAPFITFDSALMFEGPLVLVSMMALFLVHARLDSGREIVGLRWIVLVSICWVVLPLARPELILVVFLDFLLLLVIVRRRSDLKLLGITMGFMCSLVPSAFYYGYSWLVTGYPSVSAAARRAFVTGLDVDAASVFAALFSGHRGTLLVVMLCLGALGAARARRSSTMLLATAVIIAEFIVYGLVAPLAEPGYFTRYLLPLLAAVSLLAAWGVRWLEEYGASQLFAAVLVVTSLVLALAMSQFRHAGEEAKRGYDFDTIMVRGLAEHLNASAPPGSSIAAYEVQVRYFLREDLTVTSMDGITDGRIIPYLGRREGALEFIGAVRPDYWVLDTAVERRAHFGPEAKRLAARLHARLRATASYNDLLFTTVALSPEQPPGGFYGWLTLARLSSQGADSTTDDEDR